MPPCENGVTVAVKGRPVDPARALELVTSPTRQPWKRFKRLFPSVWYKGNNCFASPMRTPYGGFIMTRPGGPSGGVSSLIVCVLNSVRSRIPARFALARERQFTDSLRVKFSEIENSGAFCIGT